MITGGNINLNFENMTFMDNTAEGNGAGISIDATGDVNARIFNSTIATNTAEGNGAGVHINTTNTANIDIINTTIAGNINNNANGAGLYVIGDADTTVNAYNSILYGNFKDTTASDAARSDIYTNGNINMAYSLYGHAQGTIDNNVESLQKTAGEIGNIFAEVDAVSGIPIVNDDGTVHILTTGEAAYLGTLMGEKDGDYYFYNRFDRAWQSFTTDTTYDNVRVDKDPVNYGFYDNPNDPTTYGTIYNYAQNTKVNYADPKDLDNVSRVAVYDINNNYLYGSDICFNIGSHGLDGTYEESLHVTKVDDNTDNYADDIINIWDGEITLREALIYAGHGTLSTQTGFEDTATITFDDSLFTNGVPTITTYKFYGQMEIDEIPVYEDPTTGEQTQALTITAGKDANDEQRTVTVQRTDNRDYRLFTTDTIYDADSDWDITINGLTMQGGKTAEQGGALYVQGNVIDLTLDQTTIQNNTGLSAVYLESATDTTVTLTNAGINNTTSGDGLHNISANDFTLIADHSTINNNKLTGITNESATSDITLTYTNINGNTKDGLHNTNTGDFTFVADHSTISNNGLSGITSESAIADISLTYVSITGNTGSGVDSTTTGGETNFYAFNTTIANNKVDGIQLDSDTSINALILDSSLINNTAKGINVTSPDTTVSLYNNLLFRNGTDIHYGTAGTLQGAYNIYKTTSQDFTDESRYNTIADETHGQMLETGNVNNVGTITIGTTGQAAYRGSLLAKVNDDIYFINRFSGHWESIIVTQK